MDTVPEKTDRPRVLLVEDNDRNIRLIEEILRANRYEVAVATNGLQAIEAAQALQPDLILMDLQLPEMDGLTATRRLRSNPVTAAIPILALTAHVMAEHRQQLLEAGCCGYISKPISYRTFLEEVAKALGGLCQAV